MVEGINSLLCETAEACEIKKKKNIGRKSNNAPWFDRECQNMKESLNGIAKKNKKQPNDTNLRGNLFSLKMGYKSTIASKKRNTKRT